MHSQSTPYYHVSVFTGPDALGNPAVVIRTPQEVPARERAAWGRLLMQPATTFLWPEADNQYAVRWQAPDAEIPLCGHGALAAAAALAQDGQNEELQLRYPTGRLRVGSENGRQYAWLPALGPGAESRPPEGLAKALGVEIKGYFPGPGKQVVLLNSPEAVARLKPDYEALAQLEPFSYAVTAAVRKEVDFVSRTLVPKVWQQEDQATGSSHAALLPFWGERLQKQSLQARQLSPRGGWISGEWQGDQVRLWSQSQVLVRGEIQM